MATSKDRGDYKNVLLEEQDAVELRKAVATGSVEEPLVSSASAWWFCTAQTRDSPPWSLIRG
jgi:hypothetical protein